ncbi:SMI1/KNR4 family protein [Pseudomonas sp.]|uniref:SMI1/KNR4 family protein n=1 Tax=Pseudomonas sp. TaxID=306 RepID=UPI00258771CA|nr:SMI1/KNR4 family protein [Pseudomonas sp.]
MPDYRGLLLEDTREPATDQAIARLEALLQATLPADYRQFLKACNGAIVEYDVAVTLANGERELMSFSLFGLDLAQTWESNPHELEQAMALPDYPASGLLPIGRDGGSSLLLLDLRDGRQDVAAMVAGLPAWTGRRQQGDEYVVLAASFDAYLGALHLADETIASHIDRFLISPTSVEATLAWLDSGSPDWRTRHRERWNARVKHCPI